jgi:tetratricopeptide (TPR) repeat protein
MQLELLPENHPELAQPHGTLAEALRLDGRVADSVPLFREAIRLSGLPPINPVVHSRSLTGLGLALRELGRHEEECEALARALEVAREADFQPIRVAEAMIDHALCAATVGQWARARTDAERGLEIYRSVENNDPSWLAEYELWIARAYWAHPPLRDRALELGASAEHWIEANPDHAEHTRLRAALDDWRRNR